MVTRTAKYSILQLLYFMSAYITSIGTANPKNKIEQREIAAFMAKNLQFDEARTRELEVLYRATGIGYRHTVIDDYTRKIGAFDFFPNTDDLEPFPSVSQRMEVFKRDALPLALDAINACDYHFDNSAFTHLITVSCTGMYAPGLDIEITKHLGLSHSVQRTSINFMGCYAAINALKVAAQACTGTSDAKVLIVCLELCSIHFQKATNDDNLLANALFGDGAAAVVVQPAPEHDFSLELEAFHCDLATNGHKDMAWGIGNLGFEMALSTYVPDIIKTGIKKLSSELLQQLDLDIEGPDYYAIHPGGKKILEAIESELEISREDNAHAYEVLRKFGNMSSPTVLFVIKSLQDTLVQQDRSKRILSFAFGPGLTMESMLLRIA